MYEHEYSYGGDNNASRGQYLDEDDFSELDPEMDNDGIEQELASVKPFNPRESPHIPVTPYTPPTPVNGESSKPFGNILESPLG